MEGELQRRRKILRERAVTLLGGERNESVSRTSSFIEKNSSSMIKRTCSMSSRKKTVREFGRKGEKTEKKIKAPEQ